MLRDLRQQPLTRDELWALFQQPDGTQAVPLVQLGSDDPDPNWGMYAFYGYDPKRLSEQLEWTPELAERTPKVYGRRVDLSTQRLLEFFRGRGMDVQLVDVDDTPMTKELVWRLCLINTQTGVRAPLTRVGNVTVLGYDIPRLEEILDLRTSPGPSVAQ